MDVAALVHSASDAAFAMDKEQRITAWNPAAERLLGWSEREARGRPCYELVNATYPDGRPLCGPACPALQSFARCVAFEAGKCIARRPDGRATPISLGSIVLRSATDQPAETAIVFIRRELLGGPAKPGALLQVSAFGQFQLRIGDETVPTELWRRRQALTLLKYLVTHRGRPVHRDALIEGLWPEADERQGRERLKVVLHSLRQGLREIRFPPSVVSTVGDTYLLSSEQVWTDIAAFEDAVRDGGLLLGHGCREEALERYEYAVRLYVGDLLTDEPYADWCASERERLRELYLGAMEQVATMRREQGEFGMAVDACRKALAVEPCREALHRLLIEALLAAGRRDEALAAYRTCESTLRRELDVEPMRATQDLLRSIARSS